MLFIVTPVYAPHWRIFIQSCRSYLCQYWRRCGPHLFPLLRRLRNRFSWYLAGGMMWAAWLSLTMRYYSLSVLFLELGMPWCCVPRLSHFIVEEIPVDNGSGCPIPDRSCAWQAGFLLQVCGVRGGHLISGVCWTAEVWIWCGWSINMCSWPAPPIMGCQW